MAAKAKKTGPSTLRASKRARQITMVVIEAFAGELGTSEAAEQLGVSLSRYYQLETRALGGMMAALEPRPRGPGKTPEGEIRALKEEKRALEKALRRQQSLLRAAHRGVGLPARPSRGGSSKTQRRTRRGSRGRTVLQTIRPRTDTPQGEGDGTSKPDGAAGGRTRGK